MSRLFTDRPFTCVTCEVGIAGSPVFHVGLPFCCAGCVVGGPCVCSYDVAEAVRDRSTGAIPTHRPMARPVLVGLSSR